jgi:hypothetical protein
MAFTLKIYLLCTDKILTKELVLREMQKKPANIIAAAAPGATAMRRFFAVQPGAVFFVSPVPVRVRR